MIMDDRLGDVVLASVAAVTNEAAGRPSPLPLADVLADVDPLHVVEALTVMNVEVLRALLPDGGARLLRRLGLVAAVRDGE